ncbi:uncharacterized protein LOC143538168 [Bidens hawaiensis]|uniref:uncharacterized protein LOC143538168 n=1 Tax=Bidens hawaiensis TaxID=980011 RepID=UPI004049EA58
MWKQFDVMVQMPSCSCNASGKVNDFTHLIKLMQFLMGLDDSYQSVRTALLTKDPLPAIKTAFSIVSREESHRNSSGTAKTQTQNMDFFSKPNQSFDTKKKFNRGPNPNIKCTHCNKKELNSIGSHVGGKTLGSFSASIFSDRVFCFANNFPSLSNCGWIVDSGANQHMVKSDKNVSEFNVTVKLNNGSNAIVSKIGSIKLSETVTLTDVLVVSEYQDLLTRRILVTGNQVDGLYFCGDGSNSLKVCLVFHMAKQHREPFPLSDHQSKHIGDLTHVDVWGPYRVKSREETFFNLLKTQFDRTIKIIRSDKGPEFVNSQFQKNFRDKGIIHHTSCTYTSQQNGAVERKHRHLLNVTRSLLFQGNVPLTFCSRDGNREVDPSRFESENVSSSDGIPIQPPQRKTSRSSVLPKKLSDFVVEGKVKYGFEKVVNYSNLSIENFSFVSSLNKTIEPRNYYEATKDSNWVNAMNDEINALYTNKTWELVELPSL